MIRSQSYQFQGNESYNLYMIRLYVNGILNCIHKNWGRLGVFHTWSVLYFPIYPLSVRTNHM